jgi:hypothetical protein
VTTTRAGGMMVSPIPTPRPERLYVTVGQDRRGPSGVAARAAESQGRQMNLFGGGGGCGALQSLND